MWETLTHLVRAIDFGAILQQEMHYVSMASACCPNDWVDTVLLGNMGTYEDGGRRKSLDGHLQHKFTNKYQQN